MMGRGNFRSFVLPLAAALCAMAVSACGNMVAPSFGSPSDAATAPANPDMGRVVNGSYIVAPGDTLATVSERTNTPIRALIDNNALQPPFNIRPGQALRIAERQNYLVKSGDTLSGIAARFQVQQSALVELNKLQPPFRLRPGQTLVMPSVSEAAQVTMLPVSTPSQAGPAVESIPEAASAGSISASALPATATAGGNTAPAVQAKAPTEPKPLPPTTMPAAAKPAAGEPDLAAAEEAAEAAFEAQKAAKAAANTQASPPAAPVPAAPVPAAPVPAAPEEAGMVGMPGPASAAGFSWPVQGKVILKFGDTTDGLRNDGINIAAPAGAPVMAASDGTVAYAGNQLRGFGNLVLIRHANGLITAYAHNQSLLVKKGDKVKRGATIARVGSTGNVAKPQLHFEIRKGEEPVDPMKYLGGGA